MEIPKKEGRVFNSAKCEIKVKQIHFFGSIYSADGIRPDPDRVVDIHAMPTPQDKADLQQFLGVVNFVSPYIPNCADKAAPLRDLLQKEVPFLWQDNHQASFLALKHFISSQSCLKFFDPQIATTLEVDASQKGLGARITQDGKPIAFAFKSLSPSQSTYSNIEREALSLVFGVKNFHTYLFGCRFTVHTDHKLLVTIWRKPLASVPPRLQRLFIKLQGYDFDIVYKPGPMMVIADALSGLPNPSKLDDVPLDETVAEVCVEGHPTIQQIDLVHFGKARQDVLQQETARDPVLCDLRE